MTRTDILEDVIEDVGMLNFSYAEPNARQNCFIQGTGVPENRKPGNEILWLRSVSLVGCTGWGEARAPG